MAGDWIKMRGGLFNSPKLIAMSRNLVGCTAFREWLTPGGGGGINGQVVSDHALRCVTGALLCVTWSWSREFGKPLREIDCLLPHITIDDLDSIAGAPGVGRAMESVGWAVTSGDPLGIILPKFFEDNNVPLTNAERQRAYRARVKEQTPLRQRNAPLRKRNARGATNALPEESREEESREEERREEDTETSRDDHVCSLSLKEWEIPLIEGVRRRANELFLRKVPFETDDDRLFLLKVAALVETGTMAPDLAIQAVEACRNRKTPPANAVAYYTSVLDDQCRKVGMSLGRLLAGVELPDALVKRNGEPKEPVRCE